MENLHHRGLRPVQPAGARPPLPRPGVKVYTGQIIGENARNVDMVVNPAKGKKLTNMRASGSDENVVLTPPVNMSLEDCIAYINDDELVEVTPRILRLSPGCAAFRAKVHRSSSPTPTSALISRQSATARKSWSSRFHGCRKTKGTISSRASCRQVSARSSMKYLKP
jgi:hypothetical protein